ERDERQSCLSRGEARLGEEEPDRAHERDVQRKRPRDLAQVRGQGLARVAKNEKCDERSDGSGREDDGEDESRQSAWSRGDPCDAANPSPSRSDLSRASGEDRALRREDDAREEKGAGRPFDRPFEVPRTGRRDGTSGDEKI